MELLKGELSAAKTTTGFNIKAGQTLMINFSVAGSVNVEYKNGDNWESLETIAATSAKAANGNMVIRLVITANTGAIDANIV